MLTYPADVVVSRVDVEGLGLELVRLYAELESSLAQGLARQITAGIARPGWQTERLAAAGEVRRWAEKLIRRATGGLGKRARAAVQRGYETGGSAAARELAGVARRRTELGRVAREIPGAGNIDRLAAALAGRLDAAQPRIVRSVLDAYRQTVTAGAASVLGGADTRRDAAQRVWNRLLDHGLTGFTDARGRNWSLAGYVEMATRTTVAQAAVAGQLDRMAELGLDLCIVSDAPQECERCRPWEGKVLTRGDSGRGGATITAQNEAGEGTVRVKVAGSVDEAIGAGLMHPNCRHSLSAYLPGLTKAPPAGSTADPEGDAARQRLRALERRVRAARRQEAGALTPEAKAKAQARVANTQAQIRQHVKENKSLGIKRKTERERLDLGNTRVDARANAQARFDSRIGTAASGQDALDAPTLGMSRPGQLEGAPRRALYDYGGWNYNGINRLARGQALPYGADRRELQQATRAMGEAFARSTLQRDVQVHRGVGSARAMFGDRLDGDLTGLEWRELAPGSTSASPRRAAGFAGSGPDAVQMRILAPRGTPAVQLSGLDTEGEILLGPGQRMRVVRDRGRDAQGKRHIDVEVISE